MKFALAIAFAATTFAFTKARNLSFANFAPVADTTKQNSFTEGILYTRVSFPGNPLSESLKNIDFEKGNVADQLKELQEASASEAYAKKMQASMATMNAEEKASMGTMMMAAMMSPLYAKIYYSENRVMAKANAMMYSLESFMDTKQGNGKMVAISNDKSQSASIKFSAANLKKVWEKTEVNAVNYTLQLLTEKEKVSGYDCRKAVYTYKKAASTSGNPMQATPAYKLIVWYTDEISSSINFLHPFYFQLDKGILKIEVHYDKKGTNKMLYEVTGLKKQKLSDKDFMVTEIDPVVDYDEEPMKASMNMLQVFFAGQ